MKEHQIKFNNQSKISNSSQANMNQLFVTQQNESVIQSCPLCSQACLQILITNALYHKHTSSHNYYYTKQIDQILEQQISKMAIEHKQNILKDQEEQFMRRVYRLEQFQFKNKAITQYYKFHHDYPKFFQKGVDRIFDKYYDRKKEFQYKKIKHILKQEEDISITTQKSQSMFSNDDDFQPKSRYSNVLEDLTLNATNQNQTLNFTAQSDNQSQVLHFICQKIDKAYKNQVLSPLGQSKKHRQTIFDKKQSQEGQTRNFLKYLKKQQQKKQIQQSSKQIRSNKQSRYNSIQQKNDNNKQYSSGVTKWTKSQKTTTHKLQSNIKPSHLQLNSYVKERNLRAIPQFYKTNLFRNDDSSQKYKNGKQFVNSNTDQQLYDLKIANQVKGFKKRKQIQNNSNQKSNKIISYPDANENPVQNLKAKVTQKTTAQIYFQATKGLRKRSVSYNSLAAVPNFTSTRRSTLNVHILKDSDFQIKNRSSSNKLKQKAQSHNNNLQKRSKSINSLKVTSNRYTQDSSNLVHTNQGSMKRIVIPREIMINAMKGKSLSVAKFDHSSKKQTYKLDHGSQKQLIKDNHFSRQNMIPKAKIAQNLSLKTMQKAKDIYINSQLTNKMNIDSLFQTKLRVKPSLSSKYNKILI